MQLGWIDFSRSERNKIIQTLKMLEESTALDELGIGVIRDGYADLLFPGISTLQTRAKYFVLLPYLFAMAERQNFKRSSEILPWMHRQEDLLVPTLIKESLNKRNKNVTLKKINSKYIASSDKMQKYGTHMPAFIAAFAEMGAMPPFHASRRLRPARASIYKFAQANMAYNRFPFFIRPRYRVFV